ncbi:phage tail tip lysozyme [Ochrobactrum sp. BTU1]|uniref:phage tail tip lysozyme n=1 Tax=Ochrobactrum sp. BTU1 TaxID=2840456 RepID=UPI001C04743F|nr:hypothetical protein KMS41_05125 [Ochrobactrum sp. BTU1]
MNQREQFAMQFLIQKGWKPHQAAGIVGNLVAESSLNTKAINRGDASDGTDSVGIAQWNRDRKTRLYAHADKIGRNVNDLEAQLDFLDWELNNTEKRAGDLIRNSSNVAGAADGMIMFERPKGSNRGARYAMHYEKRQQSSYNALKAYDPSAQIDLPPQAQASGAGSAQDVMSAATSGRADMSRVDIPQAAAPNVYQPETEGPSFGQTAAAVAGNSDTAWMVRSIGDDLNRFKPDENFSLPSNRYETDAAQRGFDASKYGSMFDKAVSEESYQYLLGRASDAQKRSEVISQSGLTGAGLQLVTEIAEDLPLDIAIGSVAPGLVLGNKARRLNSMIAGGLAAGSASAAGEALGARWNPDKSTEDVVRAGVFGTLLGGAAGALLRNPHTMEEALHLQRAGQDSLAKAEIAPVSRGGSSAGAAQVNNKVDFLERDDAFKHVEADDFGTSAGPKALRQMDLGGQLGTSPNAVTRAGQGLVIDAVGKKNSVVNQISAAEDKGRMAYEFNGFLQKMAKPSFKRYAKDKGAGWFDGAALRSEFSEDIARYIRDTTEGAAEAYHPEVIKTGNRIREGLRKLGQLAENPLLREGEMGRGVHKFTRLDDSEHYLPRVFDHAKVVNAIEEYGEDTIIQLVSNGISKKVPEIADDILFKLAKGYTRAVVKRSYGAEDLAMRGFIVEDVDEIRRILSESDALGPSDIDKIVENLDAARKARPTDGGTMSRAKHRVTIDETAKLDNPVNAKTGTISETPLRFDDLLVNDALYLYERYVHQMTGRIALARYRVRDADGNLLINGFTSDDEFSKYLDTVRKRAAEDKNRGVAGSHENLEKDIANLQFAYDYLVGRPQNNMSEGWQQFLNLAGKFNFSRVMNQVGFAQITEFGRVLGHLGPKAVFSQLPEMRRILNADGELIRKSGLAEDLEKFGIGGFDRLLHNPGYRYDEMSGAFTSLSRGRFADKAEGFLNRANHVTAEISGLNTANDMLQNMTAKAIVQKWADFAHTGKGFSRKRLADLGLSEEMTERVLKQFKEPGNFHYKNGEFGGKVLRADFEKWSDPIAREAFLNAAYRQSRYIVQANDLGTLHRYFSHPLARVIMQFRTFMMGSWTKSTLKAAHMRDRQAAASILLGSMLSALAYVTQTKLKAVGRSDREEYEERLLSWESIGKAAFSRTGESSIIPMMVDSVAPMLGFDPQFSATRTSGQTSDLLFGNPTMGLFDDIRTGVGGAATALREGEPMSQQTARTLMGLGLFQNFLPVTMGFNSLISDLPEYTPKKRGE